MTPTGKQELLDEAFRHWEHAEAIMKASDLEEVKRLLADFFRYRAGVLRFEAEKL